MEENMQKSGHAIGDPINRRNRLSLAGLCALLGALCLAACSDSEGPGTPPPSPPFMDMVDVPGGVFRRNFIMGEDLTEVGAFRIGRFEVTQAQYLEVSAKSNPSWNVYPNVTADDTNRPVDKVSWFDALVFCNLLSMREGRTPVYSILSSTDPAAWGAVPTNESHANYTAWRAVVANWDADGYRLPTEAEWMWAAMGATEGQGSWADGVFSDGLRKLYSGDETPMNVADNVPGDYAWYEENSEFLGAGNAGYGTHAVGAKLPNELGLRDMSGNVSEWCWDLYASYPSGPLDNPTGATTGDYFVFRGGSWQVPDTSITVADRSHQQLACNSYTTLGFRVARRP